jgi:hypothetical protein
MGDSPTLILTTRLGVRPLGVRGDPLHAVANQLLAVIRRRLGDGPADLLAEPQMRETGDGIDWYAARSGSVRRLADLDETERTSVLATVESHLESIRTLGGQLKDSSASEEARLIGRSLELATTRPSDDFVYVVDGQPVIAAWGYEADAAASLQAFAPPPVPMPPRPAAMLASAPWLSALLFVLLLLLLLLMTSWLLRACAPVDPTLNLATMETPAPPAPEPPTDPTPVLKASLDDAQADENKLKVELAALEASLKDKVAQCKPIEPSRHRLRRRYRRPGHRRLHRPLRPSSRPLCLRRRRSTGRRLANCPATGRVIRAARASPATNTSWATSPDSWPSTTTSM